MSAIPEIRDWQDDERYLPSLKRPLDQVEPGLFIGSVIGRAHVAAHEIHVVVCFTSPGDEKYLESLPAGVTEHRHHLVDVLTQNRDTLNAVFDKATQQIHEARTANLNVLVHCGAGVSRSAAVVMDYLMSHRHLSFDEALQKLETARYCTCPNATFQACLRMRHPAPGR